MIFDGKRKREFISSIIIAVHKSIVMGREEPDFGEVALIAAYISSGQRQVQDGSMCTDKEIGEREFEIGCSGLLSAVFEIGSIGMGTAEACGGREVEDGESKSIKSCDCGFRCLFSYEIFSENHGVDGGSLSEYGATDDSGGP